MQPVILAIVFTFQAFLAGQRTVFTYNASADCVKARQAWVAQHPTGNASYCTGHPQASQVPQQKGALK